MVTFEQWEKMFRAVRELVNASAFIIDIMDHSSDELDRNLYARAVMLYNAAVEFNNLYIEQKGDHKNVQEG